VPLRRPAGALMIGRSVSSRLSQWISASDDVLQGFAHLHGGGVRQYYARPPGSRPVRTEQAQQQKNIFEQFCFKELLEEECLRTMAMRGLTQFIGDIRNCTNKEEEVCSSARDKYNGHRRFFRVLLWQGSDWISRDRALVDKSFSHVKFLVAA